ncbi:hypothetical protein [Ramlibacter tataouinensis]|uniref:Uncharacterized protein n=1 Tax=Ramlibacter tataouinensis (strain ATCC BAA-407 / DSM 14655 / LMG 21543 / TTB310) TaxID=365046 RepID=F5Y026_RAMTT|nr:hypothetical protein [Ramlibacter tataouinensis]AEG94575.1 hypothetical protein Rta_34620 [Ramlibacter tataouinensis TTB310]
MRSLAGGLAVLLCAGCASVTQGTTHALRIETETAKGVVIDDAECTLSNDHGVVMARSGSSTPVRRSSKDLDIKCASPGQPEASARLVSRANAALAGNILVGGAIGALVDHNTGAAYTYPSWVRLVFGEFAILDRKDEREGTVLAALPGTASRVQSSSAGSDADGTKPSGAQPAAAAANAAAATLPPAASATRQLVVGNAIDYRLTDRSTQRSETVILRVDRADGEQLMFNSGVRVERRNGEIVSMSAPLLGELDAVTPPGGWMPGGKMLRGAWPVQFTNTFHGRRTRYDLTAQAAGEFTVQTKAGPVRASRIDLEGWAERLEGNAIARARYRATLWFSTELRRPVKFEAYSRTTGNAGTGRFHIDELVELTGIHAGQ